MAWRQLFLRAIRNETKYRLGMIVAKKSIARSIAKKYHPVRHKPYGTFHYFYIHAQNRGIK